MDPKLEMTRQWIMRADDDLRLAELTMKDTDLVYWAATFHCQQAVNEVTRGLTPFQGMGL